MKRRSSGLDYHILEKIKKKLYEKKTTLEN